MDKKLTPKQKAFCDYYIELSGNATEAYKKAYPSCKKDTTARANASRLLTNASVFQYIQERNKIVESERIASIKEVKEYWTRVMRGQEKDQFGLDATLADRNKASENLAKSYGMFITKVDADTKVDVNSTQKLDSILEQLKEK